jgi:hypothetical protein
VPEGRGWPIEPEFGGTLITGDLGGEHQHVTITEHGIQLYRDRRRGPPA